MKCNSDDWVSKKWDVEKLKRALMRFVTTFTMRC